MMTDAVNAKRQGLILNSDNVRTMDDWQASLLYHIINKKARDIESKE